MHSTFYGLIQSDVTCKNCGNIASSVEPMLDISLEIDDKFHHKKKRRSDCNLTVLDCIEKYIFNNM